MAFFNDAFRQVSQSITSTLVFFTTKRNSHLRWRIGRDLNFIYSKKIDILVFRGEAVRVVGSPYHKKYQKYGFPDCLLVEDVLKDFYSLVYRGL